MNRRTRAMWSAVSGVAAAMLLASCGPITVNSLPFPGSGHRGGYEIVFEFPSVLNLADRAKVVQDGTTVGIVTGIDLVSDRVDVTVRVDSKVEVPSDIHATLRQATVLGDTYVALERPQGVSSVAAPLGAHGRVPLSQTASPPQLEDTIAHLANFLATGSIQRVQDTMIGINRVTPPREADLRNLVGRVAADLSDLSTNIDLVDQWLDGVSGTATVMYAHVPTFKDWFSPIGTRTWDRIMTAASYVGILLPSIGSVYNGGFWLVPLLNSLADAMGALQQSKWAFEGEEVAGWRRLFTDYFFPVDKFPAINITSIVGPDGRELLGDVQDVLRILGASP